MIFVGKVKESIFLAPAVRYVAPSLRSEGSIAHPSASPRCECDPLPFPRQLRVVIVQLIRVASADRRFTGIASWGPQLSNWFLLCIRLVICQFVSWTCVLFAFLSL